MNMQPSGELANALEALIQLKEWKDKHGKDDHYNTYHQPCWDNANAALNNYRKSEPLIDKVGKVCEKDMIGFADFMQDFIHVEKEFYVYSDQIYNKPEFQTKMTIEELLEEYLKTKQ